MGRLLKKAGGQGGHARMLVAQFDGVVRDGATFQLTGQPSELHDEDMVLFSCSDGSTSGINVEEDANGLCAHIRFEPAVSFRIGLDKLGNGVYAFRPAPHHIELRPQLGPQGAGEKIV